MWEEEQIVLKSAHNPAVMGVGVSFWELGDERHFGRSTKHANNFDDGYAHLAGSDAKPGEGSRLKV